MLLPVLAHLFFLTVTIRFSSKEGLEFATSGDDWSLFGGVPRASRVQSFIEIVVDVDSFELILNVRHGGDAGSGDFGEGVEGSFKDGS